MDRETRLRRIWETIRDIPPGSVANQVYEWPEAPNTTALSAGSGGATL